MNIYQAVDANDATTRDDIRSRFGGQSTAEPKQDAPFYWVAPNPAMLPDDATLTYEVFTDVRQLAGLAEGTVLLFDHEHEDLLRVMSDNQAAVNVQLSRLIGLPAADYQSWFRGATFNLEESAYGALLSELRIEAERKLASNPSTTPEVDAERQHYVRNDGSVRYGESEVHHADSGG